MQDLINASEKIIANITTRFKYKNTDKVAIYVTGIGDKAIHQVLGDKLVERFSDSQEYRAIERTEHFLAELSKEQNYQRTGVVSDSDISRLGKHFGVNYVCVTEITEAFGEKYISTRMIDVETAVVIQAFNTNSPLNTINDVLLVADTIGNNITTKSSKQILKELMAISEKDYEGYEKKKLYFDPDEPNYPTFQEGNRITFMHWLAKNVLYPQIAKENNIQGRVHFNGIICSDGIVRKISLIGEPSLCIAVYEAIKSSPKWDIKDSSFDYNLNGFVEFKLQ